MNPETLRELARYQAWADQAHWQALRENAALREDAEIHTRLNHMLTAFRILSTLARGEEPDIAALKQAVPIEELEAAMDQAHADLSAVLESADLEKKIALPRGPQGPFSAPAGVLLLQALTHSQHHRGQNASRMRQLGVTPPMTDFIIWYAKVRAAASSA
jgi:uncharacterized damage-inducible protein DinB